jgi:tetratricopeptide (TPR) repeat protein
LPAIPEPALHPTLVGLHHARGVALRALGRHQVALDSQEHALRCEPRYVRAWVEKGEALHALHRNDEAVAALENAVSYDAEDAPGWAALGDALQRVGRRDDALAAYERALAVDPSIERARIGRADLSRGPH